MKKTVNTEKAPAAIGPYSQGVKAGDFIFSSGQLPVNPETGELETTDIKAAAKYCLENVKAILESAGATLECVVKATVFLTDMSDFSAVNEVYATYFGNNPPSRSCVQVAALPKGAHVEIEVVAYCG